MWKIVTQYLPYYHFLLQCIIYFSTFEFVHIEMCIGDPVNFAESFLYIER